ncbi:hypothetical protein V0288_17135 [Pannus brasiliensis CCIBt3594]|uniref:Uncharacterized protein n=1 Tax=Pannus brasiliensis CCIBt3594 TaxID=1427578 RepID=A0AAW9QM27_9CHRO
MATDDRKRRILDHLSQSSGGAGYLPKKPFASAEPASVPTEPVVPAPAPVPSPTPKAQDRKRRVMDHLSLSSQDFNDLVSKSEEDRRKRKIMDHIRESSQ